LACFDEIYEQAASRKRVFCELYEASKQKERMTGCFVSAQGKSRIFDTRTENPFEHSFLEGVLYD
jgi:hypothetical protein